MMGNEGTPLASSPVQRLVAEGRILAAYLTDDLAARLPEFTRAPLPLQRSVREKFGAAAGLPDGDDLPPAFRHVEEQAVVDLLKTVAGQCGGPTSLSNLVGFEWVRICSVIAGHYVAAPMPVAGRVPAGPDAGVVDVARYCLFGSPVAAQDLLVLPTGDVVSPERLRFRLTGLNFRQQGLLAEYAVDVPPSPITVLYIDDRLVAVRHLERLVALAEGGIDEALCLVSYGYGLEILHSLPSVEEPVLLSKRPPRLSHFRNTEFMVKIPVPTPRALLRFSHDVVDLTGSG